MNDNPFQNMMKKQAERFAAQKQKAEEDRLRTLKKLEELGATYLRVFQQYDELVRSVLEQLRTTCYQTGSRVVEMYSRGNACWWSIEVVRTLHYRHGYKQTCMVDAVTVGIESDSQNRPVRFVVDRVGSGPTDRVVSSTGQVYIPSEYVHDQPKTYIPNKTSFSGLSRNELIDALSKLHYLR